MTLEEFINETQKLGIELTDKNISDLNTYKNMLQEYNKMFNLTALTQDKDIYLKHFYDSLTITKVTNLNKELNVLDIGTGAGFPGLVLKIIFPKLKITLLDSNNKKITFLENVIKELNLKDIKCIHGRAEELDNSYREYFDIVTSRAVAHLRILLELSMPFLKVNGCFIPMKGEVSSEIEESKSTLKVLNGEIIESEQFTLPIEESARTILKIEKKAKTKDIYPRLYDQIKKRPLK